MFRKKWVKLCITESVIGGYKQVNKSKSVLGNGIKKGSL